MLDRLLALAVAIAGPTIGLVLRSSRRTRLQQRARFYADLANELEPEDPTLAHKARGLSHDFVRRLMEGDRHWLARRFDPSALIAAALFWAPAVITVVVIWPLDTALKWFVAAVAALWTLLVVWAGWQTSWKVHDE